MDSQQLVIQVGADGHGAVEHAGETFFFHCDRLPQFAADASRRSNIIVGVPGRDGFP